MHNRDSLKQFPKQMTFDLLDCNTLISQWYIQSAYMKAVALLYPPVLIFKWTIYLIVIYLFNI